MVNLVIHPWFAKLKPSKLILTINNLLPDLLIRQTFPLYGKLKHNKIKRIKDNFYNEPSLNFQKSIHSNNYFCSVIT